MANISEIHDIAAGTQDTKQTLLRPNLSIRGPAMKDPIGNVIVTRLAIEQNKHKIIQIIIQTIAILIFY